MLELDENMVIKYCRVFVSSLNQNAEVCRTWARVGVGFLGGSCGYCEFC